ncbi:MAG: FAD-dependent oxidoreductase [Deltaproteobacteria bacterium]|nr:FAD-dependent oxidoreductase [Deltaproteobacteria bacterium]
MSKRIGFFICHCGVNIAGKVRVEEVAEFVRGLKNVVVARDYKFMCSDPGQEMIEKDIRELDLNRVVVASCTPRLHEKTFQGACQRGGINPYLFQMASVREQVSWVTEDPDDATRKAKALAAAAVNRVNYHQSLASREVAVHPDVLVVGSGIAGMQASLDIASAGHKVYLVERQPTVGGHMLQFDKTFPTLDCAACIGTPKMVSVGQDPNIEVLTYSEVDEVSGYIGNFKVKVRRKPRYVKEGICTGCGECAIVCPIERPSEWDEGLADRRAIYRSFPQAVPITFVIDKLGTAPCKATCPAHVSIQGYVALINQGKYTEALKLFKEAHPFPSICGRVCHHPCEEVCTRGDVDQPVSIQYLHRFIADLDLSADTRYVPEVEERREEKVAVIGSGPAGLAAGYSLAQQGYGVTVFEKLPVLGGMMAVGIPEYRLPRDILAAEIKVIEELGVEIKTGVTFGEDITIDSLKGDGYQAIFLATGLHLSRELNVEGEGFPGVLKGVDLLRDVALGNEVSLGKRVIVIGGGNVAIDVALSAQRKGAEEVTLVCLEKREEMPAWDYEIEEALEEGVTIVNSLGPERFLEEAGKVSGVKFKRCTAVFDENGAFNPSYDETDLETLEADTVIVAIGQAADLSFAEKENVAITARGGLEADPVTFQTPMEGVFAGGDVFYGPRSVVEAVECGKEAAESIHRYLNGLDLEEGREKDWSYEKPATEDVQNMPRVEMREISLDERKGNFGEIALGFNEEEAKAEAERCLECGICSECNQCVEVCEPKAIDHEMKAEELELDVGTIIVATGYDVMDPSPMSQFGYGKYPNVFTSLEFERLNNATGPTSGQILMKNEAGEFTGPPETVAILHCIGSRDENYHEYCSRVCCMYALKYGHLIHDKVGEHARIYDYYIDMRCFGKGYEEFYKRCQEEGVNFIRGKPAEITDVAIRPEEEGKLIVIGEDTLLGKRYRTPVDMVILCVAMEARKDALEVGRIFGISQGQDGFFLEEHPKMAPISTATSGVFLAGACQAPRDIPDTVGQASGAAAQALQLATRGKVEVPSTTSWIDPNICAGCQTCIELCAYTAIDFDERRGVSVINEALCKGCGSCSGFCPSGAARSKHFNNQQIFAEIEGIIDAIAEVGI